MSGWAVHWYWNWLFGPEILDGAHADYPDFWILATEACEGSDLDEPPVSLGKWLYAESYAHNIIEVRRGAASRLFRYLRSFSIGSSEGGWYVTARFIVRRLG